MMKFVKNLSNDIGIDLGTANTLIFIRGRGIVLSEPSVVAIERGTKKIIAIGQEAKRMLGRTPGEIIAIRPLRDGVIADFETTEKMIKYFIEKVSPKKLFKSKPRIVIGVPTCITEVEKRAVREAADLAGAKEVFLIKESMAAAIGANIPIDEPAGNMICDIGGGTTEISVISLGGIVVSNAVRVGGDEIDNAIIKYIKLHHNLIIGEATAEEVKIRDGNIYADKETKKIKIKGRGAITGLPKELEVNIVEIRNAIKTPINIIPKIAPSFQYVFVSIYPNPYQIGLAPVAYGVSIPIRPREYNNTRVRRGEFIPAILLPATKNNASRAVA